MADNIEVVYKARFEKLEADFKRLKGEVAGFDRNVDKSKKNVKNFEKSSQSLTANLKTLGSAFGVAFGADQLVQFGKQIVNTVKVFESSLSSLQAITGTTAKEMGFFREEAIRIGSSTTLMASEVVEAFKLVGSAKPELLGAREELAAVTEQAILLSEAGGIDLNTAVQALTNTMNQFGAGAEDAAMFTDILATSQQKGSAFVGALAESFRNVGSAAAAAGLSFEETNAGLQALAAGGLQGAEAGTKLRGVLTVLASGADETNPSVVGLGTAIQNLTDKELTFSEAVKIFGRENASAALTLIQQNNLLQELDGNLNDVGNALEQARINTDNLEGDSERLESAWEGLVLTEGQGLTPALRSLVQGTTDLTNAFSGAGDASDEAKFSAEILKGVWQALTLPLKGLKVLTVDYAIALRDILGLAPKASDDIKGIAESLEAQAVAQIEANANAGQRDFAKEAEEAAEAYKKGGGKINETIETQLSLIDQQKKLLEDAKKARDEATSETVIARQNRIIEGIEEEIDRLNDLGIISEEAAKEQKKREEDAEKNRLDRIKRDIDARSELAELEKQREISILNDKAENEKESLNARLGAVESSTQKQIELAEEQALNRIFKEGATAEEVRLINAQLEDQITNIKKEGATKQSEIREQEAEDARRSAMEQAEAISNTINDVTNIISGFLSNANERRLQELDAEQQAELENFEGTEEQRKALEEKQAKERAELKRKQAVRDKVAAISEAIIQGGIASVKAIAQFGPPPSPAGIAALISAGGITAANVALIASQPIPQFATGVEDFEGGLAKVHKDEYMFLPQGTNVLNKKASGSYSDEIRALNEGGFEDLIFSKYVMPAIRDYEKKMFEHQNKALAREVVSQYETNRLERAIRRPQELGERTINSLAKAVSKPESSRRSWS